MHSGKHSFFKIAAWNKIIHYILFLLRVSRIEIVEKGGVCTAGRIIGFEEGLVAMRIVSLLIPLLI